jgi:hypothetical protein
MKKVLGILFSALLIVATVGIDNAEARRGRNAALIGGLAVGTVLGATIASGARADYCDPRYEYCGRPVYRSHYGPRRGLVYNDDRDCWVSRNNYWGPCRAY